jgi:DNA-binding MarR family transcriptional regulator
MNPDPHSPDELLALAAEVRRALNHLGRRMRAERPRSSISSTKLSVLGHLRRAGSMTPGELAEADRLQPQSLTRALAALEEAGMVTRHRHPADRRQYLISATSAGLAALEEDMAHRDRWLAAAMAEKLTPAERDMLRLAATLHHQLAAPETDRPD